MSPVPWAGVALGRAHTAPLCCAFPCSSCCSLWSLGQFSPGAFPWSPWEGVGWTLLAQAWARWQLQLWVALFLEAAFRAVVQPGSGVPEVGETGELPPGSSVPSLSFCWQPESLAPWGHEPGSLLGRAGAVLP